MTVNNFVAFSSNNFQAATRTTSNTINATASQLRSSSEIASQPTTNIAFRRNSTSVGMVATQFQSQNAAFNAGKPRSGFENWCISDHYKVPLEEVMPTLKQLRQELDSKDFTRMTDIEIYDYIENRFMETFGEDFRMAQCLGLDDPNSTNHNFRQIANTFDHILQGHFGDFVGGPNFTRDVNRERLFGDMSKDEIMDIIRAKFPENLTYRDLALMTSEMYSVGVFSGRSGGFAGSSQFNPDGSMKPALSQIEHNKNILKTLDLPVTISDLVMGHNYIVSNFRPGETLTQGQIESRDFIIRFFGARLGSDGLFIINDKVDIDFSDIKWDFTKMLPDLEEDFISKLDAHDRELTRRREKHGEMHDRERIIAVYDNNTLTPRSKVEGNINVYN
jgi:hypothetical protein